MSWLDGNGCSPVMQTIPHLKPDGYIDTGSTSCNHAEPRFTAHKWHADIIH